MTIWKVWQRKHRDGETLAPGAAGTSESAEQISQGRQERRKITNRRKTLRAFRAYLDVLETTAYMQKEMQSQLEALTRRCERFASSRCCIARGRWRFG